MIQEDEDQHFDVALDTGSISGVVTTADGLPAADVKSRATGSILALPNRPEEKSDCSLFIKADSKGRYHFPTVPAGV